MYRVFLTLLFIFIHCLSVSNGMARTIAFVFDDSSSMWGELTDDKEQTDKSVQQSKWIYANYAAQTLAALLRKDDRFIVVQMSNPEVVDLTPCHQDSIVFIKNTWKPKKSTSPYEAVEQAMSEILKSDTLSDDRIDEQKQDWLFIMTDGIFSFHDQKNLNDSDYKNIRENVRKFIEETKGKVRIAFFLLGNEADTKIPKIWADIAKDQVNYKIIDKDKNFILKPEDIITKVRETAFLTTGCDSQSADIKKNGRMIEFSSLFPVRRIMILEQKSSGPLATVKRVISPDQKHITFNTNEIKTNPDSKVYLAARVTYCPDDDAANKTDIRVMPEGLYQISFEQDIESHDLQVLIESAVDLQVKINKNKNPEKYCLGDTLELYVYFTKAGTNEPIYLDVNNTQQMDVKASFSGYSTTKFQFNPVQHNFDSVKFDIKQCDNTLSVAAQYTGYFNLKSNIYNITADECDYSIQLEKNEMDVKYSFTDNVIVGKNTLTITKLNINFFDINVTGIPVGITFQIAGEQLSSDNTFLQLNRTRLDENNQLPFIILNNRDYKDQLQSVVDIKVRIPDNDIEIPKKTLKLNPVCRDIKLLSDNVKPIHIENLGDREPFKISLTADGSIIPDDELSHWNITAKTNHIKRLRVDVKKEDAHISIKPLPWYDYECSKCFSSSGEQMISLQLESPFPKENQEKTFTFVISSNHFITTCFKVCMLPIFFIFCALFLFLYYVKYQQKARFIRGAAITMTKYDDEHEKRPNTIFLRAKGFTRWFPFFAEKITVGNYIFEATDTVYLKVRPIKNHKSGKIFIGGTENNNLSPNLGPGTILEDRFASGNVHRYEYKIY